MAAKRKLLGEQHPTDSILSSGLNRDHGRFKAATFFTCYVLFIVFLTECSREKKVFTPTKQNKWWILS